MMAAKLFIDVDKLIVMVQDHPELYDHRYGWYKDTLSKDSSWWYIAKQLNPDTSRE